MDTILETDKLSKRFGDFEAVSGLNLRVRQGSICAFLGQNGAGKTTTLRMLLGMMRPSQGSGHILGFRIDDEAESVRIRERVAFVAEDKRLYDYMTVRQILRFTKSFFPGWRADRESDLLRRLDLPLGCKIRKLSKGMRTKLALLLAFARGSQFFILDEPTEGLDPVATEMVLQIVVSLASEGATVFFSSHQIAEVEQIADHILMIHKGKLVLDSPLDRIKDEYRQVQAVIHCPVQSGDFELDGVERVYVDGSTVSMIVSHNVDAVMDRAYKMIFVRLHPILIPQWQLALQDPHAIKPRWLPLGVSDYRFYIWHFLFDFRLQNLWVLFAIVLSVGGLLREHANGTVAFSLSLPVTRNRWIISRVLVTLLETTVLALIPAVVVPIVSVSVGQSYPIGQGFAHGLLMVGVGSVFVGLSALLSLILRGTYTPLVVTLAMLAVPYLVLQEWARRVSWARKIDIAHVMAGAWLLTWSNVPWFAIAMVCLLTVLFLGLAAMQGRRLEF